MHVIVSEKDNAAHRIATILSDGAASRTTVQHRPVYKWGSPTTACVGLAGHVVELDFPDEYNDWNATDPESLVTAPVEPHASQPDIVRALKHLAQRADRVTIATDYDREGELIGKEAYDIVRDVNSSIPIDRARFSSVTANAVTTAFDDQTALDFNLANAGRARQIIDLRWGAALTRFFTLAADTGTLFSVGRVQTPTLACIVDRERTIQQFTPDDYWKLTTPVRMPHANESFTATYYYYADDDTETTRIWDEQTARAIHSTLAHTTKATVARVTTTTRTDTPPIPFDTTEFITAANAVGINAKPAMNIAEQLYDDGYITYPRTDNTVYPDDIDLRDRVTTLTQAVPDATDAITHVLSQDTLTPTRGDAETTDHPPIHPTPNIPDKRALTDDEWRVYELIVRRFAATVACPATWQQGRVTVHVDKHALKTTGQTLVESGYHRVYPYYDTSESPLPPVAEDDVVQLGDPTLADKQTQPPNRYNQSQLISKMESLGLGTKSTRHNTIDTLYDREYVTGTPPEPTGNAFALITAVESHADRMTTPDTTRQLETDMTAIENGNKTLDEVTTTSATTLETVFDALNEHADGITDVLTGTTTPPGNTSQNDTDPRIGTCPDCQNALRARTTADTQFVGCDGYPDCEYTLALPSTGRVHVLDDTCDTHGHHHVKLIAGTETHVFGCPACQHEEITNTPDIPLGDCPDCDTTPPGTLLVKRVHTGSRLIGCSHYPDCEYTLPIPQKGTVRVTDAICADHDLPRIEVHDSDNPDNDPDENPWELGCPICNYNEYAK